MSRSLSQARRFYGNTSGGVAILFALAAVPFMLAAGAAIDFARMSAVQARLQTALDAGGLAAAASASLPDGERARLARSTFISNFEARSGETLNLDPTVKIDGRQVSMAVSVDYPMTFMRLAGIDSLEIGATTEISMPRTRKAEIALVLDYSASMTEVSGGKVKYVAMREAAVKLIEDLTRDDGDRVKFGLVPFSHHVHVTLPSGFVAGEKAGSTWSGCTQDRKYPHNTTDATPNPADEASKWGHPHAPEHAKDGCSGYLPNRLTVRPISDDHQGTIAQIKAMRPYRWTHIALGFEFGWHLLSPNQPFGGVVEYGDRDTEKVLVLLTDGRQTEPAFGPGTSRTVAHGERNLERLCSNAKGKGIMVVTLAFDLRDKPTTERLRGCASDPHQHFYIAEDDAELARAFDQIKSQLASAIYISK